MLNILDKYDFSSYIVVGVSAGPDSMCLLDLLEKKTNKIVVCHINHNVRHQSKKEEEYIKDYCKKKNLILEAMKIDTYNENNFENEARKKRYDFYEKTLKKYNAKYLFLAHHGDDLIETVLMKIARGSNIEGYQGIKEVNNLNTFHIVRPLLYYTKEDIIKYNKENNIKYFIDKTNKNIKYTRNRYRKLILPILKKEDKNIHLKFLKYSKILEEYDNYIKYLITKNLNSIYNNNIIEIDKIKELDNFLLKNTIYYILNDIYNNKPNNITEKHINSIIDLINSSKPNQSLDLPNNKIIIKEYNKLHIKDKEDNEIFEKTIFKNKLKINNFTFEKVNEIDNDNNFICRINSNDIKLPLYFRPRKDKDYIMLKTTNQKRKIKDIFIDEKIPKSKRDTYPLLVDSNDNIIWIPGIKKSNFCIKKDEKNKIYDIIIECNEREENDEKK